jgi:hypothetical protein
MILPYFKVNGKRGEEKTRGRISNKDTNNRRFVREESSNSRNGEVLTYFQSIVVLSVR